ncbi:MAG TPA: YebC/PmpR family DNA-binding transcriptional regulator [Firmicutes bacterium]|nr:YebC/PmpR family DNA-binding transcriptional regulator [Bacillota bacterium]
MAGHSKWANIKHRKARVDEQKGKIFTKIAREIIVAAREGGGDPEANFALRIAIDKAKEANMPNDNIERAIKRGTGELSGEKIESITYEGYGPGGVAFLLLINTDNRNRTAADIRHIFSKHNGNLGETGCVSWMFARKGILVLEKDENSDDEEALLLALEAGADDITAEDSVYELITAPEDLKRIKELMEKSGYKVELAEITMLPSTEVTLDAAGAEKIQTLVEALENHDDVQDVYTNLKIED